MIAIDLACDPPETIYWMGTDGFYKLEGNVLTKAPEPGLIEADRERLIDEVRD